MEIVQKCDQSVGSERHKLGLVQIKLYRFVVIADLSFFVRLGVGFLPNSQGGKLLFARMKRNRLRLFVNEGISLNTSPQRGP